MVTRLKDIAALIIKLDNFYIKDTHLEVSQSSVNGMAHSEAARGRLTHFIDIENDTINKLVILAPTEWNFHPEGVAAKSLNDLDASSPHELRQQAELLIHAIDPCVGYHLNIVGLK
jgi:coenzyme F420-reducing hydrogenase alpha subunit